MVTRFLLHLKSCVASPQSRKLMRVTPGEAPLAVHAADLATIIADYVLVRLAEEPSCCVSGCALDFVGDDEILREAEVSPQTLAAAFQGAIAQLELWVGDPGISFMVENGVPADDAWDVSRGVAVVCEKLKSRQMTLREEHENSSPSVYVPA